MFFGKMILYFGLILVAAKARALSITDERGSVELDQPNGWKYERNIFGLPHVLISPEQKDRTTISITLTGIEEVKLPSFELKKNQEQYQDGRKEWALKRELQIVQFHPYSAIENKEKIKIHQIGLDYKNETFIQTEMSYYVECPKTLVHLKSLGPKDSKEVAKAFEAVKSIKCL
jgi:hypothetical protein